MYFDANLLLVKSCFCTYIQRLIEVGTEEVSEYCFLHNHGNIAAEGSPKQGLCYGLISIDFKGYL